ncbi:hypothetical protein SAMN05216272_1041 [Pseudomonas panipatensis]|uniref:Uncharacterized protein n=1 Tax=Pseudomonas panipatensis TaxID=428992 RepID=A0A1G8G4I8_9PSED|nr:hypothetical protein SAMN05216272_1041 [Pseudomonas panipatensis]SMP45464.1 hypothetical protein SAMN06295951_101983 [Pseudomonas panipatensis]
MTGIIFERHKQFISILVKARNQPALFLYQTQRRAAMRFFS